MFEARSEALQPGPSRCSGLVEHHPKGTCLGARHPPKGSEVGDGGAGRLGQGSQRENRRELRLKVLQEAVRG